MFFGADVGGGASATDFAVVDWQGCGLGAGLHDVAYFLGTNVVTGDRRRIEREALEEYHDIVCRLGARDFTFDDCWRSYRQNMLSVLVPCMLAGGGLDLGDQRLHDLVRSGLKLSERCLRPWSWSNIVKVIFGLKGHGNNASYSPRIMTKKSDM